MCQYLVFLPYEITCHKRIFDEDHVQSSIAVNDFFFPCFIKNPLWYYIPADDGLLKNHLLSSFYLIDDKSFSIWEMRPDISFE